MKIKGYIGRDFEKPEDGGDHISPEHLLSKLTGPPRSLLIPFLLILFMLILFISMDNIAVSTKMHILYPFRNRSCPVPPSNPTEASVIPPSSNAPTIKGTCGLSEPRDSLLKVGSTKTYIITPYYEHRHREKMVITIAIVLRSEVVMYYCMFCCEGRTFSSPATCDIHSDHFNFEYGTADIKCFVPVSCASPTHVAIGYESNGKRISSDGGTLVFTPILNLQALDYSFPYEFTVCISVMFDYTNILQLVQAMEMFRILGAQRVVIYKTSCHPDIQKVLDYYVRAGFVEIIPWHVTDFINVSQGWQKAISPGELHYYGQIAALNDFVYRYMYQSHYVVLQDIDELILPMHQEKWTDLLLVLEETYGDFVGFEFESHLFPSSVFEERAEYMPEDWRGIKGVNILQHVRRQPIDLNEFNDFKVIVNPRLVFRTTVHGLLDSYAGTVRISPSIAHLYHVRESIKPVVTQDELIWDKRLWHYAVKLIPAVSKVLEKALREAGHQACDNRPC